VPHLVNARGAAVVSPSDPRERARIASRASLRYVCCREDGIRRVKKGKAFAYVLPSGKPVLDRRVLDRIRHLALPPAWTDVWICLSEHGHLQATGYDSRGRKQYRYSARWRAARDDVKYHDLLDFSGYLPGLRRTLQLHAKLPRLSRDKVLATVVSVLAETGARVGNARYLEQNGSFGLTTLLDRHVRIGSSGVELSFRGKGGKPYRARITDPKLARLVRACRDVPGQRLFQYWSEDGTHQSIESGDVNAYIQRISGPRFTAKTFRTWIASVTALAELRCVEPAASPSARKRQLNAAVSRVAERLGNTLAVCRKSYVHPAVMHAFLEGELGCEPGPKRRGLTAQESDLVALLERGSRQKVAA